MIVFSTPTKFDLRALTTFGLNAKPNSENPIGFFGTGLKYAVAVLVRNGCQVVIQTPERTWEVERRAAEFRGKPIDELLISSEGASCALPFTIDLGRNWEPWMAYRELLSNTLDEGGRILTAPDPEAGCNIIVSGGPIDLVHAQSEQFILSSPPIHETDWCDIHRGMDCLRIFYRGILVYAYPGVRSAFTYNIKQSVRLTEDRTLAQLYEAYVNIGRAVFDKDTPDNVLRAFIGAPAEFWERRYFDYDYVPALSGDVLAVAREVHRRQGSNASPSFARLISRSIPLDEQEPHSVEPRPFEAEMLREAARVLSHYGYEVDLTRVHVAPELLALGEVLNGKIFISRDCLNQGLRRTISTLLEEHLHLAHRLDDYSRAFQDHLLDLVARIMDESAPPRGEAGHD